MDPTLTIRFDSLAAGGDAVGRTPDGQVAFVPGAAPGDLAAVRLTERRRGYVRGALLKVLEPGPVRVHPACALAASLACGGCPYMHVSRQAQLQAKEDMVRRALRHTGAEILPILAPTPDLGYRLRARLVLRGGHLGFQAARSHRVAEVRACPVLHPALAGALFGAQGAAQALRPALGEEGTLAAVVGDGGAVHLAVDPGAAGDARLAERLALSLIGQGGIVGVVVAGRRHGQAGVPLEGAAPLQVAADGFAQASAAGHDLLPALVDAAIGTPGPGPGSGPGPGPGPGPGDNPWPRALELYAGSGNLTRRLCQRAREVLAVESDPGAAGRLRALRLPGVSVLSAPAEQLLPDLLAKGERFPVAVLNPPRTGAAEVVEQLGALGIQRLVYVSCDPMTLGRDLQRLAAQGLLARRAQPVDLMPQTAHVETVVEIQRHEPAGHKSCGA